MSLQAELTGDAYVAEEDAPTVREFATKRMLVPDGPYAGQTLDPSLEAPQDALVDALDGKVMTALDTPFRSIAICWATQSGKSTIGILAPSLHQAIGCKESVVYCLPTGDLLTKVWTTKLEPSIKDSGLGSFLPDKGPGSKGGRPPALPFRDPLTKARLGSMIFTAGGLGTKSESGQAGVTVRVALLDEADEYENSHRLHLVRERAASFGDDMMDITASTVKKDRDSVILDEVHQGTNCRAFFRCPHCGTWQKWERERISYGGEDEIAVRESARYACSGCAVAITEDERLGMLSDYRIVAEGQSVDENGVVIGDLPRVMTWSMTAPAMDFSIGPTMPKLAARHWKATRQIERTQDHGGMRSYYRDCWCEGYTGDLEDDMADVQRVDAGYLAYLSREFGFAKYEHQKDHLFSRYVAAVPPECTGQAIGCDVQGNRIYWTITGCSDDGTKTWDLAFGYEHLGSHKGKLVPFSRGDNCKIMQRIHEEVCEIYQLTWIDRCVDINYETEELEKWLRRHKGVWHGIGGVKRLPKAGKGKVVRCPDLLLWESSWRQCGCFRIVDEESMRRVHRAILAKQAVLGSGLTASDAYILHLDSWEDVDGKWKPKRRRDDWFDCRKYTTALIQYRKGMFAKPQQGPRPKYGKIKSL